MMAHDEVLSPLEIMVLDRLREREHGINQLMQYCGVQRTRMTKLLVDLQILGLIHLVRQSSKNYYRIGPGDKPKTFAASSREYAVQTEPTERGTTVVRFGDHYPTHHAQKMRQTAAGESAIARAFI